MATESRGRGELGDSVVCQLDVHSFGWVQRPHQDIARLDVSVDDVERMEVANTISYLQGRGEDSNGRVGGGGGHSNGRVGDGQGSPKAY